MTGANTGFLMNDFNKGQHIFQGNIAFDIMGWGKNIPTFPPRRICSRVAEGGHQVNDAPEAFEHIAVYARVQSKVSPLRLRLFPLVFIDRRNSSR